MKTVGMVSLGCAKNRVDSENLLGMLRERGYEIVADPAQADVIFVNTCGFIEAAKEESIDTIFEMAEYKKTGRLQKLFVTGCLAQRYGDTLFQEMPEVDGFMGVSDYARLYDMLDDAEHGERPLYMADGERFLNCGRVLTTAPWAAYVKISDGCNNRCTYCAIPLIRGSYASRPFDDIVTECERLAAQGVTEITLIAQDTSRYGCDLGDGTLLLPALLRRVSEIEGVHWVRVLYCYPDTTTDALLDEIQNNPKVAPYLDLPLQHIDDALLKKMNRRGSAEWIRSRIAACKARGITLRTTFIVGFPGETEEDFQATANLVREVGYGQVFTFIYSKREGTPAAKMDDPTPHETIQHRFDELVDIVQEGAHEQNQRFTGRVLDVLVEGTSKRDEDVLAGRSPHNVTVHAPIPAGKTIDELEGTIVKVRIDESLTWYLSGEVVDA